MPASLECGTPIPTIEPRSTGRENTASMVQERRDTRRPLAQWVRVDSLDKRPEHLFA